MALNLADDYQAWQDLTSWYKHSNTRDTLEMSYLVLGLTGESGEAADAVKKALRLHGDEAHMEMTFQKRLALVQEIGDVLWYVTRFCTYFRISLDGLMLLNMLKLYDRLNERQESGLGPITWPMPGGLDLEQARTIVNGVKNQIAYGSKA